MSDAPNHSTSPSTPSVFSPDSAENAPVSPPPPETVADISPAPIEWQPLQAASPAVPTPVSQPQQPILSSFAASPVVSTPPTPSVMPPSVMPPSVMPATSASHSVASEPIAPEPPRVGAATNPVLAMLTGAVLACLLLGSGVLIGRAGHANSDDVLLPSSLGSSGVNAASGNAIVRAVKAIGPAVMNVDTTFGKPEASDFLPAPGQDGPREGKGTGFIIDSKRGLMLTNAHVIAGAQKIQVTTRDGKNYTGRVLGFDRRSDIGVVVLSNKSLPQAKLATFKDARDLPIGDWAIAIGNPYAQENTVTVGVLSAVGRTLPVPANEHGEAFALTDMMQTDAAINPGNSGGPLCNTRGEVIGINTAILGVGQNLGFTIPINKAKSVADQIIKNGKVLHPFIGVAINPVTDALQSDYGLPDKNGALVQSVEPNSPAAQAGLQPGDVIRKLNGQAMQTRDQVFSEIKRRKVGETMKIEILRNNSVKKTLTLKVGDQPD